MKFYYCYLQVTYVLVLLQNYIGFSSSVSPGFGYYCTRQGSHASKLTFDEARQTCQSIPSDGDLEQYEFGRIACRLYKYGQRGPCETDKVFVERSSGGVKSSCGVCICDDNRGPRPFLREQLTNQCSYIYDQGTCPDGEWLVLDRPSRQLVCEENPCMNEDGTTGHNRVLFSGKCVGLYSRNPACEQYEDVGFVYGSPVPTCVRPSSTPDRGIASISQDEVKCTNGKFRSLSGRCQASWIW